jgi:hypothetical protein
MIRYGLIQKPQPATPPAPARNPGAPGKVNLRPAYIPCFPCFPFQDAPKHVFLSFSTPPDFAIPAKWFFAVFGGIMNMGFQLGAQAFSSIPKGLHHSARRWPNSERAYAGLPTRKPTTLKGLHIILTPYPSTTYNKKRRLTN